MIALLVFIGVTALLLLEGFLLASTILKKRDTGVSMALAYPLGVLLNAALFFAMQITGVHFTTVTIFIGHMLFCIALALIYKRTERSMIQETCTPVPAVSPLHLTLLGLALAGIALTLLNGAAHAFILPSSYWDTFTNWNMRAVQGLHAGTFMFPGAEKPQYPILLHALQALYGACAGWREWMANGSTFLLSITAFGGVFTLTRKRHGVVAAGWMIVALLGLPLAAVHLMQGYADIHVAEYALLSALLLDMFARDPRKRWFILSALFATAAAMTKFDGWYFVALPWIVFSIASLSRGSYRQYLPWLLLPACMMALWFVYTRALGLGITPHGQGSIVWQPGHLGTLVWLTLSTGSMGVYWFMLPAVTGWLAYGARFRYRALPVSLWWGVLSVGLVCGVYVFTKEVTGEYDILRALLLPTLLWTQGAVLGFLYTSARCNSSAENGPSPQVF